MRWLRGGSLRQALERGPWNLEPASHVLSQVASTLAYAHRQGVVHRDVKPANVLLDEDGNAYLSDFGIAARLADSETARRPVTSSPAYVPPEQLAGQPLTPRSDIYGLGLLTFELLTGQRPPMDGALPSLRSIRPELPAALDEVVACATASGSGRALRVGRPIRRRVRRSGWDPDDRDVHARGEPVQGPAGVRRDRRRRLLRTRGARRRARACGRRPAPGRGRRPVRDRKVVRRQGWARPGAPRRGAVGIGAVARHRHVPGLVSLRGARRRSPPCRGRAAGRPRRGAGAGRARDPPRREADPPDPEASCSSSSTSSRSCSR